jgi:L-threonylcarbamoyladenylate synthase
VVTSLGGRIPLVVDGGITKRGIESTIVAATGGPLRLLRRGPIEVDAAPDSGEKIQAPGQLASHYAPSKPLRIDVTAAAAEEFLIGFGNVDGDSNLSRAGDVVEAAARLFDLLHEADASSKPRIAVAPVPGDELGAAINDRLRRAAAGRQ